MMNSCRSGVFLPMKKESSSSLLWRWCRFTGSRRMFSPMKSLNSPAEISPRPLKRVISWVAPIQQPRRAFWDRAPIAARHETEMS